MKKSYLLIFSLISFLSFSQKKETNGNIYKNGMYVEEVKALMNTYKTNSIKKIKKAYKKISIGNLIFRDALNNMDYDNPLGIEMNLEEEMENMRKIFETYEVVDIKELGYPDHLAVSYTHLTLPTI